MAKTKTVTEMTPTERKIEELKAQFKEKVAEQRARGAVEDLQNAVRQGLTGDKLYASAKAFCNHIEAGRRAKAKQEENKKQ